MRFKSFPSSGVELWSSRELEYFVYLGYWATKRLKVLGHVIDVVFIAFD